jgi:hypothetical protein
MDEFTPEQLLAEVIDVIALGYPFDKPAAEKTAWMAKLQKELETRAPLLRARTLPIARRP